MKKAIDYIDEAIALTRQRQASFPKHDLYPSLLIDLDFLRNVVLGVEKDKSKLHKMYIGAWPADEFYRDDPEHADVLGTANLIRDQIANGLKIQLPDGQPLERLPRN